MCQSDIKKENYSVGPFLIRAVCCESYPVWLSTAVDQLA